MPRRAAPGREDRILAALSPTLRAAVVELHKLFLLGDWQRSGLAPVVHQAAVLLEARRIADTEGGSEKDAIDAAAIRLGLSADTTRSRFRDWYRESRGCEGALTTPTPDPPGAIVDGDTDHPPDPEVR
jgi:hypothetical protein